LYFLSWYGFTIIDNPEKIKEYPINVTIENSNSSLNLNLKNKNKHLLKLNFDLDLYALIIELSSIYNVDEFTNGFYSFNDISINNLDYKKEDPRREKIEKLKKLLDQLKILINSQIKGYYNQEIAKDHEILEEAIKSKDFYLVNFFNVVIEEKKVKFFYFCEIFFQLEN